MPNTNRLLSPFQAVITELGSSTVLRCPADVERLPATNAAVINRTNTSYFYGYTALASQPLALLAGDRNFTYALNGGVMARVTGNMQLEKNKPFDWWRDIHRTKGNILLGDGSVHRTNRRSLMTHIAAQPDPTFRWFIPNGDAIRTPVAE